MAGACSVVVQCIWHRAKRLRAVQVFFNLAGISIAITSAYIVYHFAWLRSQAIEYSVVLLLLAGAYYLAQTFPVATVIALTDNKSIWKTWRECYLWSWPYYLLGAASAGLFAAAHRYLGWQTGMLIFPAGYLVYRSYALHTGRLEDQRLHAEEMAALHLRMIESLALAIESKDQTTHDHLKRVETYAVEIGKELGLSSEELRALQAAALLHDVGKIAVPEHILNKPGRLTAEEFEKMKVHPTVGADLVERARFPYAVAPVVRSHHERWDGSGYPLGLKRDEIPIGARILGAVDCLDALASDRQYRRALPLEAAMRTVAAGAGTAFDPQVIEVLQRRYVELEAMARAELAKLVRDAPRPPVANCSSPAAGFELAPESPCDPADAWCLVPDEIRSQLDLLGSARRALPREFATLAATLGQRIPFDALIVYARHGDLLVPEYSAGVRSQVLSFVPVPVGQGVTGWVAANAQSLINANPALEPSYRRGAGEDQALASALVVPIAGSDQPAGVLALYRAAANAFTSSEARLLEAVGSLVAHAAAPRASGRGKIFRPSPQPLAPAPAQFRPAPALSWCGDSSPHASREAAAV